MEVGHGTKGRHLRRQPAAIAPVRPRVATPWDRTLTIPVEIAAPDRASAALLMQEARSHFHTELVELPGPWLLVRLEPLNATAGWMFELLAFVERWLEACSLPVARVHHGSRSYLITATSGGYDPEPAVAA